MIPGCTCGYYQRFVSVIELRETLTSMLNDEFEYEGGIATLMKLDTHQHVGSRSIADQQPHQQAVNTRRDCVVYLCALPPHRVWRRYSALWERTQPMTRPRRVEACVKQPNDPLCLVLAGLRSIKTRVVRMEGQYRCRNCIPVRNTCDDEVKEL